MSQMMPQESPDVAALLAQLGGGQSGAPLPEEPEGDWLTEAINAVHEGMVQESDPKQVSMLGKIIDLLTTFQAKAHAPQGNGPAG
jgi:hypothetical protein